MAGWVESRFRDWMKSVERRLSTMETQQRLFNASVKGGAIVAYNDAGNQVARLGRGSYGTTAGTVTRDVLALSDSTGSSFWLLLDTLRGLVYPSWPINMAQETAFELTPAAGTVSAWRGNAVMTSQVIVMTVYHLTQAGTTAEFWLDIDQVHQTNHYVSNTGGALHNMQFQWDITSYGIALSTNINVRLFCNITSGAGNLYLLQPETAYFSTIDYATGATVGGF